MALTFIAGPRGQVGTSTGAVLTPEAASVLLEAYGALFRGDVPTRPWPPFLPDPEVIRAEWMALRALIPEKPQALRG